MKYRREIDGLRAIAVLPVVFFHAGSNWFAGGFVGVDIFFVISGYLITSILLAEKEAGDFSILKFYERRARRILPALFCVMFVSLPFAWYWMLPYQLKEFSQSLLAVSTFVSNLLFWKQSGYFDTSAELKPLLHTWSLAVEEQYYVFFPLFLIFFWQLGNAGKLGLKWAFIAIAVVSLSFAQWVVIKDSAFAFYLLPTRGWELLIGALIPVLWSTKKPNETSLAVRQTMSMFGLILLVYAIFYFDKHTPFPSVYALVPTVGAALILKFGDEKTIVARFLSHRVLVGLGLVSYSAYLWHQPILAFFKIRTGYMELPGGLLMPYLAVVVMLAYLSFKYVEKPFRSRSNFTRKQVFLLALLGTFFFVVLGVIGHVTNGFYSLKLSSIPSEKRGLLISIESELNTRSHAFQSHKGYLMQNVFSKNASTHKVVVVGDSMGVDLALSLVENKKMFPDYEFRYLELTNDCLDSLYTAVSGDCEGSKNSVLSSNLLKESDLVVATFLWKDSADFSAIERLLSDIKSVNEKLLVLGSAGFLDIASVAYKIAADNHIYNQREIDMLVAMNRRKKFDIGNERILLLAKKLNLRYLDRHHLYCDAQQTACRILFFGGGSVLWDNAHLTTNGRKITAEKIYELGWLGMIAEDYGDKH